MSSVSIGVAHCEKNALILGTHILKSIHPKAA